MPSLFEFEKFMKTFRLSWALLIVVSASFWAQLLLADPAQGETVPNPVVDGGVLDLRKSNWRFATDGPVSLSRWDFFGNRLIAPDRFQAADPPVPDAVVTIPGFWNGARTDEGPMGRYGYGTLALAVDLPAPSKGLALRLGLVISAYEVWLNGAPLGGRGRVGTTPETARGQGGSQILLIPDGLDRLEFVIHLSNFDFYQGGGSSYPMELGSAAAFEASHARMAGLAWFIGGALVVTGLYHLMLFAFRPQDRSTLWFGLFCLLTAFRTFTFWFDILYVVAGEDYFTLVLLGRGLLTVAVVQVFPLFVASLFPKDFSRTALWVFVGGGFLCDIIMLTIGLYIYVVYVILILTFLASVYISYVVILTAIRKREQAYLFIFGWVPLVVSSVLSISSIYQISSIGELTQFGFLFFVFVQAVLLAQRFSRSFREVETLSRELTRNNRRLRRLDELKDQFLANTSHELRTPLNGIIGLTESLRAGAKGPVSDGVDQSLEMVALSGRRLSMLINDILDSQKLREREISLSRRAVDLHAIVELVLQLSRPLVHGKDVRLSNAVPPDLPPVDADENRLQQILQNLIGNAIKFTREGSVVVDAVSRADQIEIGISDTGIGIPEDKLEQIFESFEQVDSSIERAFGGTGLGLSITRNLVELHGGTIRAESVLGEGSRFIFTLAKAAPGSERAALPVLATREAAPRDDGVPVDETGLTGANGNGSAHPLADQAGRTDRASVLVVDDDAVNRHVIANFLGTQSYRVIEAEDGAHALALIADRAPDLILLDIMMPRLNGYEVCRRIRAGSEAPQVPVIFLSAKVRTEDVVAGFESGGNDYLPKPVAGPELLARVATQLKLTQIQAEIVRKEKLAAIGQVATGIVHDFKNAIGVIKGYAEMIAREEVASLPEASEFAGAIATEADRIAGMTNEILEYVRGEFSLDLSRMPVSDFLVELERHMAPLFRRKSIDFRITNLADRAIEIDSARMVRAFLNIAGNAADAMQAAGLFELKASARQGTVVFELADDGPGIPEAIRDTLFDPFVTHGKATGTGLGMALVKGIVEAHGGTVHFETETGSGTTFFVTLAEAPLH